MSEMDRASIVAEAASRLTAQAYGLATRDSGDSEAVDHLVNASGWNPALLTAAMEQANRLDDESSDEHLETAAKYLREAASRVRRRVVSGERPE